MEKIWETVARGRSFPDLHFRRTMVWLFPKSPWNNCFITQLFWITETLSTVRLCSSLMSGHLTFLDIICHVTCRQCTVSGKQFLLLPAFPEVAKLSCNSKKCVILILIEHWVIIFVVHTFIKMSVFNQNIYIYLFFC